MSRITVTDDEHYQKVMEFAHSQNLFEQFNDTMERIETLATNMNAHCTMSPDWAPHSFGFVMVDVETGRKPVLVGGIIYQGPDQPADGSFPSLTVSLHDKTGWFIHT